MPDASLASWSLASLRTTLVTSQRRKLLDEIWQHYLAHGEWPTTRQLHHPRRANEVRSGLEPLGGSIVWDTEVPDDSRYQLSFLGSLLTSCGAKYQQLVCDYLAYLRRRYEEEFTFNLAKEEEVQSDLHLDDTDCSVLGKLIGLCHQCWRSSQSGQRWAFGVPPGIDRLPHNLDQLHELVEAWAFEGFRPDLPVGAVARGQYLQRSGYHGEPSASVFASVESEVLRRQLETDWVEAIAVYNAKAWKATLILCGSVLEGLLLNALLTDEAAADNMLKTLRTRAAPRLWRWGLGDLIDVANQTGLLDAGAHHLSRAVTEYRNLVHPGRQLRSGISANEEEAGIAINAVKICLRSLSEPNRTR